jgi:hypothetical protein
LNIVIFTKDNAVFDVLLDPAGHVWFQVKAAERDGGKVFAYHLESETFSEVGEYGWRTLKEVPDFVKLALMIVI